MKVDMQLRREYFVAAAYSVAAVFLQSQDGPPINSETMAPKVARLAVLIADATMEELDKEEKQ